MYSGREKKVVAVIGAGAAGLVSARYLLANDFEVIVFEHDSSVGGTWLYSPLTPSTNQQNEGEDGDLDPLRSAIYDSLVTNLPMQAMAFSDFPFVNDEISFVHHPVVLEYLQGYSHLPSSLIPH